MCKIFPFGFDCFLSKANTGQMIYSADKYVVKDKKVLFNFSWTKYETTLKVTRNGNKADALSRCV